MQASTTESKQPGLFGRAKAGATTRWRALKAGRPSVRHTVDAWNLLRDHNGNQYAAAITYFSFLALFPLLLLAVGITGFVLHAHPAAQQSLFDHITTSVPGTFGKTLHSSVKTAITARAGVGLIGLVGVFFTGLGWIGNLRAAIDGVWGRPPAKQNFVKSKATNLLILGGLGLGILISLALTVLGTALTDQILSALNLDHLPGAGLLVRVLGILLAVLGDVVIFSWMFLRMPQADVERRIGIRAAVLASVGFEILKVAGTYTIAASASSPTAGPFAGILAVLIWIQLVVRFILFCVAWTAVLTADVPMVEHAPAPMPARQVTEPDAVEVSPAAVAVTLVGAGAVAGAAAVWLAGRHQPDARDGAS